jgi:hypothetical protein
MKAAGQRHHASYSWTNRAWKEGMAWAGTGKGEVVRARGAKTRIAYPGHNTLASVSRALRDEPPIAVAALASLMIDRTVAMQRPQFRPQPRHLYTANGVRGHALLLRAALISESVRTLQEQMIINAPSVKPMDVPESGSLTRRLLIRKTRMEYFLRLELLETTIDSKQLLSAAMPACLFGTYFGTYMVRRCEQDMYLPAADDTGSKKIRAAIEGPESRLSLETLAGWALTWAG